MTNSSWLAAVLLFVPAIWAQDNYEIQVYGAETMAPGATMVELHSNFTFSGSKQKFGSLLPTEHAFHETLEVTHGFNDWFEIGFYVFMSENRGYGYQWVGDHIRPRVRAPEKWHLPVGLGLSAELGYQRPGFSRDNWTLEIRPIVDKQFARIYMAFNPTLVRSFHGPGIAQGLVLSPNFKVGYDLNKRVNAGIEYYGSVGRFTGFDPFREQQQQIIPAVDLNLGPNWEFNFGVGVGVTHSTDHLLIKMIIGRRFGHGPRRNSAAGG